MDAVDIARTVSAADQMGSMNEELQKQLFNRIETQKRLVDLRKIGAALDVNTKTVVRSAVVEQQRIQREARKVALLAPPKAKDDSKVQAVPVLAHRVSDILSEAKALVMQLSHSGEMDRPGSEQRSLTARSGLDGTSAPTARRNSLSAAATKARVKQVEQASSKDDDLDDERYAGPARAVAAETKAALFALVHKKEQSRRSRLYEMNRTDEKLSELLIKKHQDATPRKPSPAGHDRTSVSVGVELPLHINAREEPRRQALVAKAEGKLRALANAEFMHRYADRLEFGADVCLCPENIMAAALSATSRTHGRETHRHHIRPGAAGGYNPHTGHMEFSTVMGSSSDKGSREGGGDSAHDAGRSPVDTSRQSQSHPATDPIRFPELRRYLHHIMAITAGRMVFNIPSKSFEVRYFTPLIEEMIILAFWHVQVRFIEERERQKANRKKAKARRLALKGASAAAAGETPVARRKAGLTPTSQAAQESRFSQVGSGGAAGGENIPEAPDVSLTAQEEVEAELAAAMTPTYEGLTTMTCIGHYMALAYTTLMKNVVVERLAEDAEDEQAGTGSEDMHAADTTAQHTGIIAEGPEPAVQRKRKYLTMAEKRALAVARARMSRAFLDILPWAIADTVWQAYWHLLAGSRGSYGAAFRLQIFVEIGRLLTGVELAPITVLSSLGRHFPTDPMALLHREFVEGAEAEAASLLMMGRRGQDRANSVDGSSSAAASELALKASNRGAHIYSARTPGQVSALLGGPLTGVPAGGSKSMKMALEEGDGEAGPGNSADDPYGLTKQEVDYVLTDQRVSHLARSLGFRTPFELFKSTRKADRLLLGLGEASRVEVLRKLHRTLALPVSAYLMSGAPVPPPLLQASATVGAMLNLPPASHPSMRKALDAGYQPLSPIAGTSGASMHTSLGKSLRHGITAIMNQEALQDAPTLANPALNSYLIHMERWAEEALADEVYRVNDEEAENRKRAILAAAAAVAAKQKARTSKGVKAAAPAPVVVAAVVPEVAEAKQEDSDEEVWVNPTPHSPARLSAVSHMSTGRGFSSGYSLGGTKASLTRQLAGTIKEMAMGSGMVSLGGAASSTPSEASELDRRQALLNVRSQTQMLRLTAELDAAGGHINKMARKIGKGLKKLVQEKLTHPSTADLDSTAHTAFSGLDESADFSAPDALLPVLGAGHENSNRQERVVLPPLKKDNTNSLGFASMLAQESELAVPTLVTFRESDGEAGGQAQGDARHVAGNTGAAQHGGKAVVQFESSHARTQSRKARFPLLSPIDSGTPNRGSHMLQPELHSQGALAGTVTDRHGLASIVHTVPTGLGATDADLATKILTARSKKRPLQVPFVYTTASTLLTRALPDAKSQSKGHTAMRRLVPVSWAHVGGVDTAHAYYREAAKDHIDAIHNTNARIQAEAAAAAHATKVADYHARSSADTARVDLLKGSAQTLAREAAKVRQERIKSSKERASKAQKQREEKRLYRTALGAGGKDILDLLGDGQDSPTARAASPVRGSRRKKDDGISVINKSDPGFAGAVVMQGDPVLMNVKVPGVNKASLPPVSVNLMQLATLAGNTEGISGAHAFVLDMDRLHADTEAEKEERKQYGAIQAKSLAEQAKQEEEERRRKALAFR